MGKFEDLIKEKLDYLNYNKIDPIYFYCPDFLEGMPLYEYLLKLAKTDPYVFYPGAQIKTVFGNFYGSIWNGGTLFTGGMQYQDIESVIKHYNNDLDLSLTFTFTNPLIETQSQCEDAYSNIIAELGHNGKNAINVTSPILEAYLRKHYPNYQYCRSILASEEVPYDLSNYEISVLQRAKNNDWEYLDKIPQEDRKHIEILLNDPCPDNCPRIYDHYRAYGKLQLLNKQIYGHPEAYCIFDSPFMRARSVLNNKTYISPEQLYNEYVPKGFNNFKISGRGRLAKASILVIPYLIIPEFQMDVLGNVLIN